MKKETKNVGDSMDLSGFFERLEIDTAAGSIKWTTIKPDSKEPFYGYKANHGEYEIKIMARAEGVPEEEIPFIAVKIKRDGKVVMLVERQYPSISEKQIVLKKNEVFWPITKIQNIIEKKPPTNTLNEELEKIMAK